MVEHRLCKAGVAGSKPVVSTLLLHLSCLYLYKGKDYKGKVKGWFLGTKTEKTLLDSLVFFFEKREKTKQVKK